MTKRAWRLVREKHAATAFNGEGAALYGGRWNSRGNRVVYASINLSLAALETLVHLNPRMFFRYLAFPVDFDESLVEKAEISGLPADWREEPPPPSSQRFGDEWLREARSAVIELPSVIVPGESNYLLNLSHPGFQAVSIGKPEPFSFDPRLIL